MLEQEEEELELGQGRQAMRTQDNCTAIRRRFFLSYQPIRNLGPEELLNLPALSRTQDPPIQEIIRHPPLTPLVIGHILGKVARWHASPIQASATPGPCVGGKKALILERTCNSVPSLHFTSTH